MWTALLLAAPLASAPDSWAAPATTEYVSASAEWKAKIVPGECIGCSPSHLGKHTGPHAKVELTGPNTSESFELVHPKMPVGAHLSDEGILTLFDHWGQTGHGSCAVRYDAEGELVWSKTLEELLGQDRLKDVTRTVSSRHWLRWPLHVRTEGGFSVALWNSDRLKLDDATGDATYVVVTDFGDDAHGWYLKSQGFEKSGDLEKALAHVKKAAALDRKYLHGFGSIAYKHHLAGKNERGIALLLEAVEQYPGVRELKHQLVYAYQRGGLSAQAEPILRELLKSDPGDWAAESAMANLLFQADRDEEGRALVEAHFERLLASGEAVDAIQSAAYLCSNAGERELAAEWYRKGEKEGAWNESIAGSFVALLEYHLDQKEEAAQVLERLIESLEKRARTENSERRESTLEKIKGYENRVAKLRR